MKSRRYFIFLDILGFDEKALEEHKKTDRPVDVIRHSYITSIDGPLEELKKRKFILDYTPRSSPVEHYDSWLISTNEMRRAIMVVGEVLNSKLPLEVAIGYEECDSSYLPFRTNAAIRFLHNDIISPYKKYYKNKHKKRIEETFILFTVEAFNHLGSFKRLCSIPFKEANFYLLNQEKFEHKLSNLAFLELIGSNREEYCEIDELYIPPNNYETIKKTLEENHLVILSGDPEMGKTYTAIRLLWEYFREGRFKPLFLSELKREKGWKTMREGTEIDGKVIYIEDPWGKIKFETIQSLYTDISIFTNKVKSQNCRIIITTREKVFMEFEKRMETNDLRQFVNQLTVDIAYGQEELKMVLRRYIDVFMPLWHNDASLINTALNAVGTKMRTPLSVVKLIHSSMNTTQEEDLRAEIEKASQETMLAFANDIKELYNKGEYDKLVLLCFAYMETDFVMAESCYLEVLKGLKEDFGYDLMKARAFKDILDEVREVEEKRNAGIRENF